jgi:hypothetical protein
MRSTEGRRFRYGVVPPVLMVVLLVYLTGIPLAHALPRPPSPSPQLPPCPVDEGDGCPQQAPCHTIPVTVGCVPMVTSLFPVGPPVKGRDGFFGGSGPCGTKSCFGIFRCPCGIELTNGDICNRDGGSGC